ncbi:MAG: 3-dehydroquinate synthase, partial [candidate division Zixibacteria bacterium]|nr:3-dehydroquinate synthase [candidate division Zixibacteria bacterium]
LFHGEAVAIGMVAAARLAIRMKLFAEAGEVRLLRVLNKFRLPVSLSPYRLKADAVLGAMQYDKKRKEGNLRFVLPSRIGSVVIRDRIDPDVVRSILVELGAKS